MGKGSGEQGADNLRIMHRVRHALSAVLGVTDDPRRLAAPRDHGWRLAGQCRPHADYQHTASGKVAFVRNYDNGFCWGAFATLQRATALTATGKDRVLSICTPAGGTRSEMVAVFVEFVARHPERRHEDFFEVALDALQAAYPCK